MTTWQRLGLCTVVVALLALGAPLAHADSYMIWDDWGGAPADAEKTLSNTDDDLLCWAAASSNILEWTGWGAVGGMTNTDEMFAHFQQHFTDLGGNPYYGWAWWFDGINDVQGTPGWAQEDVDGGGGFWLTYDIDDYRYFSSDDAIAMATIDDWLHEGYGTTISLGGGGAHSITVWGFDTDSAGAYAGLWVTDSDDSKNGDGVRPNLFRYYDVEYSTSTNQWFLQDYYGADNWFISEVVSLDRNTNTNPVPEPGTIALLGLGLFGVALQRKRRGAKAS